MAIGGDYVVHIVEMLVNGWSVVLRSSPHNTERGFTVLVNETERERGRQRERERGVSDVCLFYTRNIQVLL